MLFELELAVFELVLCELLKSMRLLRALSFGVTYVGGGIKALLLANFNRLCRLVGSATLLPRISISFRLVRKSLSSELAFKMSSSNFAERYQKKSARQ